MKVNYKLLIIGNVYDNHLIRFIKHLKLVNPNANIEVASLKQGKEISKEVTNSVNKVYLTDNKMIVVNIPIVRSLIQLIYYVWSIKKIVKHERYDIINIHFPKYDHSFILPLLKKSTNNIVLTPWGSDVYRIGKTKRFILKYLYKNANYVTGVDKFKFKRDVENIYNIPKYRQVNLAIGSEMIETVSLLRDQITTEDAKKHFGIEGKYVITCGYNASKAQRHKHIIESIAKIKDSLPSNLLLLFPFTYPADKEYKDEIKKVVDSFNLKAIYFEHYLDNEELFYVRQCTDMFIHIQTTDAHNGSLMEYLLLNKKIINGSWLIYDDMEVFGGKPYVSVDKLDDLPSVILRTYKMDEPKTNEPLRDYIAGFGVSAVARAWNRFFEKIAE